MSQMPIFCNLNHKRCLVVGGGNVARHKVELLLAANADVIALAPDFCAEMNKLATIDPHLTLVTESYQQKWLTGCWLVFAATNSSQVNALIAQQAEQQQIFCNVADAPERASFFNPAVIDKSPILIALSTGGHAPVYSRILKQTLSESLPADAQAKVLLAAQLREQIKKHFATREQKRQFWQRFFSDPQLSALLTENDPQQIENYVASLIN